MRPTISRSTRRTFALLAVMLPLAACNVNITSPDDGYGGSYTRLSPPGSLVTVPLDGAVELWWNGAGIANSGQFQHFRVYSTPVSRSTGRCDDLAWAIEGTTVSDGFLVANLPNDVSRCFAVSTVARDGGEGLRSAPRMDAPRANGRMLSM